MKSFLHLWSVGGAKKLLKGRPTRAVTPLIGTQKHQRQAAALQHKSRGGSPQPRCDGTSAKRMSSIYGWAVSSVHRIERADEDRRNRQRRQPPRIKRSSMSTSATGRSRSPLPRRCWREEPPKPDELEEFCHRKVERTKTLDFVRRKPCSWVPCAPVRPLRFFRDKPPACTCWSRQH